MKKILYQHKYYQFEYDEDLKLFELKSFPESAELAGDEDMIMEFLHKLGETLESLPEIHYFLDNQRDRNWVVSVEVQEWIAENHFPIIVKKGTKKMAHILPPELVASISSEQLFEEAEDSQKKNLFPVRMFETYHEAMTWLLEK